jgi:two-component system LytT family response regulator
MIRTLIVDDEENIREVIRRMLEENCENVEVVAESDGVKSTINAIRQYNPDLVLLDIKLIDGTGFDVLDQIDPIEFKVIFITAYEEYAVKAFKFSALDYLLKPVEAEDLIEAVKRTDQLLQHEMQIQLTAFSENMNTLENQRKKLILKTLDNIYLVKVQELLYCHSDGAYTEFITEGMDKIVVSKSLKEYQEMLGDQGFFRAHKSFLINLAHILRFEKAEGGYLVMSNEDKVPVSSRKREELLDLFDKLT